MNKTWLVGRDNSTTQRARNPTLTMIYEDSRQGLLVHLWSPWTTLPPQSYQQRKIVSQSFANFSVHCLCFVRYENLATILCRMCIFKRIVYGHCSHSQFLGPDPARKCHLQLAYECRETTIPCGSVWLHSYVSIKVEGMCKRCNSKIAKARGTLSTIKNRLEQARLTLKISKAKFDNHVVDFEGGDDNEAMSPVLLTCFSTALRKPVTRGPLGSGEIATEMEIVGSAP